MLIKQMLNCQNPVMSSLSSNMLLPHCACTTTHQIQSNPACCGYLRIRWTKSIYHSCQGHTVGNIDA